MMNFAVDTKCFETESQSLMQINDVLIGSRVIDVLQNAGAGI